MTAAKLKRKLKSLNEEMKLSDAVRLHRAISWLRCAEDQHEDLDISFISLWIAYNACYAVDDEGEGTERAHSLDFIGKLVHHDQGRRFETMLWNKYSGPVRMLIENEFVFRPFWEYQRNKVRAWQPLHKRSIEEAHQYMAACDVPRLLQVVLDRLHVLRNQVFHGGATFKSKVNRSQLRDGMRIMALIVPLMIDIMIDSHKEDWGRIHYPVIE